MAVRMYEAFSRGARSSVNIAQHPQFIFIFDSK